MLIDIHTPPTRYGVIYADPAWTFLTRSAKGKGRSAENHYDCMTIDDIKALPVSSLGADDSALLLWVTDPFLEIGFEVMKAWGYKYSTVGFCWAKLRKAYQGPLIGPKDWHIGQGYSTRANQELCLLGRRGSPKRIDKGVRRLVVDPVREHSRKPDRMYGEIERLYPGPYVELFGRTEAEGWDTWGNQADKFAPTGVNQIDAA